MKESERPEYNMTEVGEYKSESNDNLRGIF